MPSLQSPRVEQASVSPEACTVKAPASTATTVRHTPEQAIEAPSVDVGDVVGRRDASVRARRQLASRRSRRTRPTSVMIPVNMA